MKEYINRKLIEDGLMSNIIKPILEDGELKCYIGDYWFYFGGSEFESTSPSEIPFSIKVKEIKTVLDEFRKSEDTETEYKYYYYYLCENI